MASGRSSRNVFKRFGVVAVRLGRREGTLCLGGGRPAAFWSVLERLGGIFNAILKRGGPLGSPRRNTWLRGRASRSVLKRFEAFGRHFRSWRSRDRRSHQGPAAQHIESRGPAPAGPGGPAGGGGGTAIRRQAALGTGTQDHANSARPQSRHSSRRQYAGNVFRTGTKFRVVWRTSTKIQGVRVFRYLE